MTLRIDVLATDGSPLGVTSQTIWGDQYRVGLGGAELALLTLCEEWAKKGYQVRLYNDPKGPNDLFEQLPCSSFEIKGNRDILVVFRSPNIKAISATGKHVWLSTDQSTIGDFRQFAPHMEKIVVISDFHAEHFKNTYGIHNSTVIDIPIRVDDYANSDVERIPNRILFSSVPARGLTNLWRMWPYIQSHFPGVDLVITSDYRLWGVAPSDGNFRGAWVSRNGYQYKGAMPRAEFIKEQLAADILFYPSNYAELFCLSVAESAVAGSYPITSATGALPTTNMGLVIGANADDTRNDRLFMDALIELLSDRETLEKERERVQKAAIARFHPDVVLKQWDEKVFGI